MRSEDWFPTRIWFYDLNLDFEKIKNECLNLETKYPTKIHSNNGGWQSDNIKLYEDTGEGLLELIQIAEHLANLYIKPDMKIKKNFSFKSDNSWININRNRDMNLSHIHPFSLISSCIYINSPDKNSPIIFENPKLLQETMENYEWFEEKNELTWDQIHYEPVVGRILFFPSWLKHWVKENNSHYPRISMSTNYNIV